MDGKKGAIIRIAVLAITTVNAVLTASGKNPIPFNENAFTECLAYVINGACAVWAWWKNNNVTRNAQHAQKVLNRLNREKK